MRRTPRQDNRLHLTRIDGFTTIEFGGMRAILCREMRTENSSTQYLRVVSIFFMIHKNYQTPKGMSNNFVAF